MSIILKWKLAFLFSKMSIILKGVPTTDEAKDKLKEVRDKI